MFWGWYRQSRREGEINPGFCSCFVLNGLTDRAPVQPLGCSELPRVMADTEIPPLSPDDAKLIRNERAKLTAMWVNGVAVASVAVGGISPSVAIFSGTASALTASALLIGWSLLAGILHLVARRLLGALRA